MSPGRLGMMERYKAKFSGHFCLSISLCLLLIVSAHAGSASHLGRQAQVRYLMGTLCEIVVDPNPGSRDGETAINAAFEELKRIDALLSNWKTDSELMRMNAAASAPDVHGQRPVVAVSPELFQRLRVALDLARRTGGLFDPTIGPLVRAWGFLSSPPQPVPLRQLRARVGWRKVRLDPVARTVTFAVPGMEIDLGGIAKGYAAERAVAVLRRYPLAAGMVSLGGSSIKLFGNSPQSEGKCRASEAGTCPALSHCDTLAIRDPRDGESPAAAVRLCNSQALATSGTYEKTAGKGKRRRSHIFNPLTGEPLSGALSVTVISPDAEVADALTKPLFFLQPRAAASLLAQFPNASAMLITGDGAGLRKQRLGAYPERFLPTAPSMLQKRVDDQPSISREMLREAEDILHAHLKRVGLKHTGQRDTILRTFLETRDHLSTDELHRLVKKKDAKIGFTTVYRTLKLLAECGLASEVAFHDGVARYEHQYNRRSHHHMVCTECGASVEFFSPELDKLEQEIGHKHRYATTRHTFQIYGTCEACRKKATARRVI